MMQRDSALSTVQAVGAIHFEGNVIPHQWYQHLKHKDGKPDTVAIIILSEIVYWYRPRVEKDERTGRVLAYHKRFKADKLQRSHGSFAEQFGFTKRQVRSALDYLEEEGLITTELREVVLADGVRLTNVLFIGIDPKRLKAISIPSDIHVAPSDVQVGGYDTHGRSSNTSDTASDLKGRSSHTVGHTYTEITPEITTKTTPENNNDVVEALTGLGLTKRQASAALKQHALSLDEVAQWRNWKSRLKHATNGTALLAALLKEQRTPPKDERFGQEGGLSHSDNDVTDTKANSASADVEIRTADGRTSMVSIVEVWEATLSNLQDHISENEFETWIKPAALITVESGIATVGAPNVFVRQELEGRYVRQVGEILQGVLGYLVEVRFVIGGQ